MRRTLRTAAAFLAAVASSALPGPQRPQPPVLIDTSHAASVGRRLSVSARGDLQRALDDALPGDVIELEPGAVYEGPFTLPRKTGEGVIVIRSTSSRLPAEGARVGPEHAPFMPKLQASEDVVVRAAEGARGYRFVGVEVRPAPGIFLVNLVEIGGTESDVEDMPSNIVFERSYLHGDPVRGARRGLVMNGRYLSVIDSHLSDFKDVGPDSQAVAGWMGPGPFKIVNNYLEAAGENVLFGGGDPRVHGVVPSDIEIRGNHLRKPLRWKQGHPSYEGTPWTVKNLLELKNARRVRIEENLLENNWRAAQSGFAVLFTVRNQNGRAPWSVVEDVVFASNVVRRAEGGINFLGRDGTWPSGSGRTRNISIRNNLFEDIEGRLFQILEGTADVVIEHNTSLQQGSIVFAEGEPHTGFVFRDNITPHNEYGISGTGAGPGLSTLERFFPGAEVRKNVLPGGAPGRYPGENFFPTSLAEVGFVDLRSGDYRLSSSSVYRGAGSDGRDPGVDFGAIAGVLERVAGGGRASGTP